MYQLCCISNTLHLKSDLLPSVSVFREVSSKRPAGLQGVLHQAPAAHCSQRRTKGVALLVGAAGKTSCEIKAFCWRKTTSPIIHDFVLYFLSWQASVKKEPIDVVVKLTDGRSINMEIESASTSAEVCQSLAEEIGLKDTFGFSLYISLFDKVTFHCSFLDSDSFQRSNRSLFSVPVLRCGP